MAHRPQIYRLSAVVAITGLCSSSVYELASRNLFPRQFKLAGAEAGAGSRAVGWSADEVDAWVAERIASRTDQTLTPIEQEELHALLARLPAMCAESDTSGMTIQDLRGLMRFLRRKAQVGV